MLYTYQCSSCGNCWEHDQPMSSPAVKTCPRCHKRKASRVITGGLGFVMKGGGWAKDLYSKPPVKPTKELGECSTTKKK